MADIRDAMEELALILSHRSSLDSLEIVSFNPPIKNPAITLDMRPVFFDAQIIPYIPVNEKKA